MSKIKDLIEKVRNNGTEYNDLSLIISKRVWLIIASLYYLSYLFTVGGFYFGPFSINTLSMITFHLYSVLVIATVWFLYSLCEYGVIVYFPKYTWLKLVSIGFGVIFAIITLSAHLGLIGG